MRNTHPAEAAFSLRHSKVCRSTESTSAFIKLLAKGDGQKLCSTALMFKLQCVYPTHKWQWQSVHYSRAITQDAWQTAADERGVTGSDGASALKTKTKTQPAVISRGDHLLITAIRQGCLTIALFSMAGGFERGSALMGESTVFFLALATAAFNSFPSSVTEQHRRKHLAGARCNVCVWYHRAAFDSAILLCGLSIGNQPVPLQFKWSLLSTSEEVTARLSGGEKAMVLHF